MAYTYGGNANKRQKQLNKALTGKATDSGERANRPPKNEKPKKPKKQGGGKKRKS